MTVNDILAIAIAELGVRESPPGSGHVKYNTWYYGRQVSGKTYPWCMAFVQWAFAQGKAGDLLPCRTASCGALMRAAKNAGRWITSNYRPGDIAIYSFTGKQQTDHAGIIERVNGNTVIAIEGNTGWINNTSGGKVMRRKRSMQLLLGAVRPPYKTEEDFEVRYNYVKDVPDSFRPIVEQLMAAEVIRGSGGGSGEPLIDLSHDMLRVLVWGYRGGAFDRQFIAQGMSPVVQIGL